MRGRLLWGLFLLFTVGIARAGETPGWQALLANKWEDAGRLLAEEAEKATGLPDKLNALEGQALLAKMQGRDGAQREAREKMARLTAKEPSGAFFFFRFLNGEGYLGEKLQAAEEIYADSAPANRARIAGAMRKLYYDFGDWDKAGEFAPAAGTVDLVARLSGPYRMKGPQDTDQPLPPQTNPAAPEFVDDFGVKARAEENVSADGAGIISPADHLAPTVRGGEVVLQIALESARAQDAHLVLHGNVGSLQVWLNTYPLYKGHYLDDETAREEITAKVKLREGVNTLLVRCQYGEQFCLQVLDPQGTPLTGVKALPYRAADWEKAAYRDFRGVLAAEILEPTLFAEPDTAAAFLWRIDYLLSAEWREGAAADDLADALARAHPQSAAALLAAAETKREVSTVSDSAERLITQCEELCAAAEKVLPDSLLAACLRAQIYADRELPDQVLENLAPFADGYPECAFLHLQLANSYLGKKFDTAADKEIGIYAKLRPDDYGTLSDLRGRQGRHAEADRLTEAAIAAKRIPLADAAAYYNARGRFAEEKKILDAWAPRRGRLAALGARLEWEDESGNYNPETWKELQVLSPYNAAVYDAPTERALRAGDKETAVSFLRKSLEISASQGETDIAKRRRLESLAGDETGLHEFDIELATLAPEKVVKNSKASHAKVLDLAAIRIYPDLSTASFRHVALKPFDRTGVEELGELEMPRNDQLLYCRTIQPDGSVFVPESADNSEHKAMSMYNVKPGSVLEYAHRNYSGSTQAFSESFNFGGMLAETHRSRLALRLPRALLSRAVIRTYPEDFAPQITELPNDEVSLVWDAEKQEGVLPEKFMPQDEPPLRRVEVRVFGNDEWRTNWHNPFPRIRTSPALRETARAVCKDAKTSREKLNAVFRWLAENIQDGDEAEDARDAFALKAAGEDGMAALCRAMLDAVGVRAYAARANPGFSRQMGKFPDRRRKELFDFHSGMLAVEIPEEHNKEWLVFHGNQKFFRLHDIGVKLDGALALTESPWGLRLENLRSARAELSELQPARFALRPDGSAQIDGAIHFFGTMAGGIRQTLENPHRAKQMFYRQLAEIHPHLTDISLKYPHDEELNAGLGLAEEGVSVEYSGVMKKYAREVSGGLSVTPEPRSQIAQLVLPLPRHSDVEIPGDIMTSRTFEYEAPAGWAYIGVPPDYAYESEFGLYLQDFHVKGRRLTLTRALVIPAQKIKAAHAADFNRFLALIKAADEASFQLEPLPEGCPETAIDDWGECGRYDKFALRARRLPAGVRALLEKAPVAPEGKAPETAADAARAEE